MKLTKDQVLHISTLCRIKFTQKQIEKFRQQLSSILDYVSQLNEVNTKNVEPISQITGLENVSREDIVINEQSLTHEEALSNAPEKENHYFQVKSVF